MVLVSDDFEPLRRRADADRVALPVAGRPRSFSDVASPSLWMSTRYCRKTMKIDSSS